MSGRLDRRGFLELSALASALFTAGQFPALRALGPGRRPIDFRPGAGVDGHLGPPAIKPVLDYHERFLAVRGNVGEQYKLRYQILNWSSPRRPRMSEYRHVGTIEITRRMKGVDAVYEVSQVLKYQGTKNHLRAWIFCDGTTPVNWSVHTRTGGGYPAARTDLKEVGVARGGAISIDNGSFTTELASTRPLTTQWTVLDELMRSDPASVDREVDLLQDLSLLKPAQRLVYEGDLQLGLANGKTRLASVSQVGFGTTPTHYLIDDGGRVQLVTCATISWALRSIEAV